MLLDIHTHKSRNDKESIYNALNIGSIPNEYFSFGIHPWCIEQNELTISEIEQYCQSKRCLAIGEIGLDKLAKSPMNKQVEVFMQQIEISEKFELPVIIHCVKAWNELKVLKRKLKPKQNWIYHGFNKANLLDELIEDNWKLSIGASILSNIKLQLIVNKIPDKFLFIETDDNSVDIFEIYKKVSEIKEISLLDLEKIIEKNFRETFRKWQIG